MLRRIRGALRTLRWRLTLTFVALLALLLAGLGTYQYVELQHTLESASVQSFNGDVSDGIALLREEIANERLPGGGRSVPGRKSTTRPSLSCAIRRIVLRSGSCG